MNMTFVQFKRFITDLLNSYATDHDLPQKQTIAKWLSHFIAYIRVKLKE